ncbi:MAG: hypothetical protein KIH08_16760 [Candidatus Freyarchaeota archaeon]|nr:hypothetical protein [Candidatus Jordarchaeia archaeon]MBS7267378.1 hypothetical protein [Candidatus Jordarchaeia archaeon]MBS7281497.1 hypothetical protein [Candidatus Jordarchaeia archaeon]
MPEVMDEFFQHMGTGGDAAGIKAVTILRKALNASYKFVGECLEDGLCADIEIALKAKKRKTKRREKSKLFF